MPSFTNLNSNFDPTDVSGSGLQFTKGTPVHDVVIGLVDEIVSLGPFGKLTGSSPTPAGLQYLAGNMSAGGTSIVSSSVDEHFEGVYFKKDEELVDNGGDTALALAFMPFQHAIGAVVTDPVKESSPGLDSKLNAPLGNESTDSSINTNTMYSGMDYSHEDQDGSAPPRSAIQYPKDGGNNNYADGLDNGKIKGDLTIWVFVSNTFVGWLAQHQADKPVIMGCGLVKYWGTPSDNHYTRSDVPGGGVYSWSGNFTSNDDDPFRRMDFPRVLSQDGHTGVKLRRTLPEEPKNTTIAGDIVLNENEVFSNNKNWIYLGKMPFLVAKTTNIIQHDTMSVGGYDYMCLGVYQDNNEAWFVPFRPTP